MLLARREKLEWSLSTAAGNGQPQVMSVVGNRLWVGSVVGRPDAARPARSPRLPPPKSCAAGDRCLRRSLSLKRLP